MNDNELHWTPLVGEKVAVKMKHPCFEDSFPDLEVGTVGVVVSVGMGGLIADVDYGDKNPLQSDGTTKTKKVSHCCKCIQPVDIKGEADGI